MQMVADQPLAWCSWSALITQCGFLVAFVTKILSIVLSVECALRMYFLASLPCREFILISVSSCAFMFPLSFDDMSSFVFERRPILVIALLSWYLSGRLCRKWQLIFHHIGRTSWLAIVYSDELYPLWTFCCWNGLLFPRFCFEIPRVNAHFDMLGPNVLNAACADWWFYFLWSPKWEAFSIHNSYLVRISFS
jgi:hypothetical protein